MEDKIVTAEIVKKWRVVKAVNVLSKLILKLPRTMS